MNVFNWFLIYMKSINSNWFHLGINKLKTLLITINRRCSGLGHNPSRDFLVQWNMEDTKAYSVHHSRRRAPKIRRIMGGYMAQLCIMLIAHQKCEPRPGLINNQSGSDKSGAETGINHGFLTTEILSDIIKLVSMVQLRSNTFLHVHLIPGEKTHRCRQPYSR